MYMYINTVIRLLQLFNKLQQAKQEIAELQEEHIRERQELEQTQEELTRELKLKYVMCQMISGACCRLPASMI